MKNQLKTYRTSSSKHLSLKPELIYKLVKTVGVKFIN